MTTLALLHAIGSCSLFASRVFMPAFLTAALLRFGPQVPLIGALGLLDTTASNPIWFTSDACLWVLLVLSLAELVGDKVPEVRDFTHSIDIYAKPVLAALTALGVVQATDAEFAGSALHHAGSASLIVVFIAAGGTAVTAWLRQGLLGWIEGLDPDDSLHLRQFISYGEDVWMVVGALVLVVLPLLMALTLVAVGVVLALVRKTLHDQEQRGKQPCPICGVPAYRCAVACASCHGSLPQPRAVGVLGQPKDHAAADLAIHRAQLLGRLRCPSCAGRLRIGDVGQRCAACQQLPFELVPAEGYLNYLDSQRNTALALVAALSLVPILGFVVASVYVQLVLIAPMRIHLPVGRRTLVKWGLRVARWLVFAVQWLPGPNAVVAVGFTFVQFRVYRRMVGEVLGQEQVRRGSRE